MTATTAPANPALDAVDALGAAVQRLATALELLKHTDGDLRDSRPIAAMAADAHSNAQSALWLAKHNLRNPTI